MKFVDGESEKRIAVVFTDHGINIWIQRLFRKGFRHCFALIEDGDGAIQVNMQYWGVHIDYWPCSLDSCIAECEEQGITVVTVLGRFPKPYRLPLTVCTCVGIIKVILGVRAFHVWTPYHLYRYLYESTTKQNT